MDIITVLKANIRYKKSSFISILLLMMIISASLTTVLSTMDNCGSSMEKAHQISDSGELLLYISDSNTNDLQASLQNHPLVKKIEDHRCVAADEAALGDHKYRNPIFLLRPDSHEKLIRADGTAYLDKVPALKKGEVYVPKGLLTSLDGEVGDTLAVTTIGGKYSFMVKGIILEPYQGAFVIGYKQIFISDEDMGAIQADARAAETEERTIDLHALMVYQADDSTLTSMQFRRKLNLDTGITDQGTGSLTKEMSLSYTGMKHLPGAGNRRRQAGNIF